MAEAVKAATFEDFLDAPSRFARREAEGASSPNGESARPENEAVASRGAGRSKTSAKKEKVGLTIAPEIIDAVDDYIYRERKQGRRLKKNDVYEAALRQFLGLEKGGDR